MVRKLLVSGVVTLSMTIGTSVAASERMKGHPDHAVHTESPVLPAGRYLANVKALVCEGCIPLVEKAILGVPGIESVTVDKNENRVDFAVKKGASVKWSSLQATLKASADKMGMGADYTLSDFKIASAKPGGFHAATQVLGSGYYTAKVGAIVCGGCKELIEKTMRQVSGIGTAQVDDKAATVRFTVLAGKKVQLTDLQKALQASADNMGMGADYVLSDVKPMKKA